MYGIDSERSLIERRVVSVSTREDAGGELLIRHLRRRHPGGRVVQGRMDGADAKEVWYRSEGPTERADTGSVGDSRICAA